MSVTIETINQDSLISTGTTYESINNDNTQIKSN